MANSELRRKWKDIVDEFRNSGLTVAEWSRKHDVKAGQLYYWAAKFRQEDLLPASQIQWLQVEAGGSSVSTTAFEVKVGNATIVVRPGFDPELLGGIVRALGHAE